MEHYSKKTSPYGLMYTSFCLFLLPHKSYCGKQLDDAQKRFHEQLRGKSKQLKCASNYLLRIITFLKVCISAPRGGGRIPCPELGINDPYLTMDQLASLFCTFLVKMLLWICLEETIIFCCLLFPTENFDQYKIIPRQCSH